jgi:DNA-binding MurR/RpiR family transcriptional regulator
MSEVNGYAFDAAAEDWHSGAVSSMRALARKHAIPEATLRRYAKEHGWVRGASEVKRELVREALAGESLDADVTQDLTHDEVRQRRLAEATQDVEDMQLGLKVARACMGKLLLMVDSIEAPADIKRVVDANKAAVETIRKIRSLDDEPPAEAEVKVTVGDDDLADLRAAFRKRLEGEKGAATGPETV